jgi:hypothetical protein
LPFTARYFAEKHRAPADLDWCRFVFKAAVLAPGSYARIANNGTEMLEI